MPIPVLPIICISLFVLAFVISRIPDSRLKNRIVLSIFVPLFLTYFLAIIFWGSLDLWLKAEKLQPGRFTIQSVRSERDEGVTASGTIDGEPATCHLTWLGPLCLGPSKQALATTFAAGASIPVRYLPADPRDGRTEPVRYWSVPSASVERAPTLAKTGVVLAILLWTAALYFGSRGLEPGEDLLHLFAPRDSSQAWAERPPFEPALDLRSWALSSIRIGEPEEAIRRLGRPDNRRPHANGRYAYLRSGAVAEVSDGRVDCLSVVLRPEQSDTGMEGAKGSLVGPNGKILRLTDRTTLCDVAGLLGEPARKDEDEPGAEDAEIVWFYEFDGHSLDVEAQPDGHLKRLLAYAQEGDE